MVPRGTASLLLHLLLASGMLCMPMGGVRAEQTERVAHRRVLLLVDKPNDPFADRIRAEVSAMGFEVVSRPRSASLEADARAEQAVVGIRILPTRRGVEVWMADATSGRSMLRQLIVDENPGKPDHGLIALQTVELLRTGFFPKPEPKSPPPADQPVVTTPALPPPSPPTSETVGQAGIGFLYSPGGVPPMPQIVASLQQISNTGLGVGVDVGAALRGDAVSNIEGKATFRQLHVALTGLWQIRSTNRKWVMTSGLGAGVASLTAHGQAVASLEGTTRSTVVGLAYLRGFLGRDVRDWLSVGVGGAAGATVRRAAIRFAGYDVANYGWPMVSLYLMAEIH